MREREKEKGPRARETHVLLNALEKNFGKPRDPEIYEIKARRILQALHKAGFDIRKKVNARNTREAKLERELRYFQAIFAFNDHHLAEQERKVSDNKSAKAMVTRQRKKMQANVERIERALKR